jgi:hypothetical protein
MDDDDTNEQVDKVDETLADQDVDPTDVEPEDKADLSEDDDDSEED